MAGKLARVSGWRQGYERRSLRISGLEAARSQEILGGSDTAKKLHDDVSGSSSEEDYASPRTHGGGGGDVADLEAAADMTLPEKTVLELVLDTLQRRDTCEIFGEPLDPQKFEDYYRIIQEPMDFGTMRAKLNEGMYTSLEQFQYDVFLITRNAMRFNPSFFKQAQGIDELAKKVFHLLLKSSNPEDFEKQLLEEETIRKPPIRRSSRSRAAAATTRVSSANNRRSFFIPAKPSVGESSSSSKAAWFSYRTSSRAAAAKSRNHQAANTNNSLQYDRRSTYIHRIFATCPKALQVKEEQLEIGYQESLMQFVKDLGPTANKVAKLKLLALRNAPNPPCQQPSSAFASSIRESTPTTSAAAPPIHYHHHQQFHLRVIVLALPCDTTRKKRAAAPLQDLCFNNNINSHHMLPRFGSRRRTTREISQAMQTKVGGGTESSLKPSSCTAAPPPPPQFKFNLQFLQTRLDQMKKSLERPSPPMPPLLQQQQQPCASLVLGTKSDNNLQEESVEIHRGHLSLQL